MTKKKYFTILLSFILILVVLLIIYIIIPKEEPPKIIDYGDEYLMYSKIFELELSEDESYYSIKKLIKPSDEIVIPNTIDNIPVKKWYLDNKNGISFKTVRVVKIPANIDFIGDTNSTEFSLISTNFSELVAYVVDENNEVFSSVDGVLYSKDKKILYKFPNQKNSDSPNYTINDYVEEIYKNSFCGNTNIQSIRLGKNVLVIGSDAFRDCEKLINVTFNENLQTIHEFAFYECNISNLVFPSSLKEIMSNSFCGNYELTSVTIHKGIENIGRNAFSRHSSILNIYTEKDNVDHLKELITEEFNDGYQTIINPIE